MNKRDMMELICEKFKEKVNDKEPVCAHPEDYCKFRTACLIHFMEKERKLEGRNQETEDQKEKSNSVGEL